MPYFDKFVHVYGWNLSILWSPLNIWMPQNFTIANFGHPVSKSWLRTWTALWWLAQTSRIVIKCLSCKGFNHSIKLTHCNSQLKQICFYSRTATAIEIGANHNWKCNTNSGLSLTLLVTNLADTKWCKKTWKMTETLAYGYSSERTQWELSQWIPIWQG